MLSCIPRPPKPSHWHESPAKGEEPGFFAGLAHCRRLRGQAQLEILQTPQLCLLRQDKVSWCSPLWDRGSMKSCAACEQSKISAFAFCYWLPGTATVG